ncbi:MAG: flavodoxin family protein, partial [Spongiibacter sp.]
MSTIAVLFHSGYGHTERLAQVLFEAIAAEPDVSASFITINQDGEIGDADWSLLDGADAIVFGSPTYMGGVSWQFKRVADASSGRWMAQQWKDKLAAGFTNSASINGDKSATLSYLHTFAM